MAIATKRRNNLKGIIRKDIEKPIKEAIPKKHHQSDYEQETIIVFNKAESEATVYTHEQKWQKHFEKRLKLAPVDDNNCGGKTYKIDKKRISLPRAPRAKRVLTETQKKTLAQRLRQGKLSFSAHK